MAIRCEHVLRLELRKSLQILAAVQRSKFAESPVYQFSRISYFGHACPKINFGLISRLTGKCATQNLKNPLVSDYGHIK